MQIVTDIQEILREAKQNAYRSINKAMIESYWLVGKRIVEEDQKGESRAAYGKEVMKKLSEELQKEFGNGFSIRNIEQMRLFYMEYPIPQTLSAELDSTSISEKVSRKLEIPEFKLSWSHYLVPIRIADKEERKFYES